jgi:hypothetical protein
MKTQIAKLKQELKDLASQIRATKKLRTKENNGYVLGLNEMRQTFRHKHVAYCLVRGRALEKCDSGKKLDMDKVTWVINSMNPEKEKNHKLYVVVNSELTPSQQAVQSGHAVAAFLKKHPHTQWSNGYLIYLKDKPSMNSGNLLNGWLEYRMLMQYAEFKEPDLGDKVTAYACFGPDAEFYMKNKALL